MKVGLLITNGGPHPADKWADQSVDEILDLIQIAQDSTTPQAFAARQAKRDLAPKLFAVLHQHHDDVQQKHRGDLKKAKRSQVGDTIEVAPHMGSAEDVLDLLAETPFAMHFAQDHVKDVVRQIIGQHTANVIDIERRWHADGLKGA